MAMARMAQAVDANPVANGVYMGKTGEEEAAVRSLQYVSWTEYFNQHQSSAIMILRTWRGGSKSRWHPWRDKTAIHHGATRPRDPHC